MGGCTNNSRPLFCMQLRDDIPNFSWSEVLGGFQPDARFWRHMELLQGLREWWGASIQITSGFRSRQHNEAIGGAAKSQHMVFATDCMPSPASPHLSGYTEPKRLGESLKLFAAKADAVGFDGIGMYDTFVHLDLRGETARWDYQSNAT